MKDGDDDIFMFFCREETKKKMCRHLRFLSFSLTTTGTIALYSRDTTAAARTISFVFDLLLK